VPKTTSDVDAILRIAPQNSSARVVDGQSSLSVVIMAAGEGSRMKSSRPKPLHRLCGKPMIGHVLDAVIPVGVNRAIVVVGHGAERVMKTLVEEAPVGAALEFVTQHVQRGTGDAVSVALTVFTSDELDADSEADVIVMPGDQPLFRPETIFGLVATHRSTGAAATVLSARVPDPTGLGRIVRDRQGRVRRIVEHRDATDDERAIDEINTSVFVFKRSLLAPALRRLSPENSQGEYYLTDVVAVLADAGYTVSSHVVVDRAEAEGVNDRVQLARAEAELRRRTNDVLMRQGVTMLDPDQTYVDATVTIGTDVTLFPGVLLQGHTTIGSGCEIGPNTRLVDCIVGEGSSIEASTAHRVVFGAGVVVGPYAAFESGTSVSDGVRVGPGAYLG
jgi:bifunctional UDP-N-acetylglucosamine pyrophosphorylase / glucosamine-1-phosphate N-acetyltransferase